MPATINGQVLDQQDKPVANAKVIVRVMRCDSHGYPTGCSRTATLDRIDGRSRALSV